MIPIDLLMIAVLALAFWLLILRPAKVRRKAQLAMVAALEPGRRIMTTAGLFGTVVETQPGLLRVELAPGVVVEMVPEAVGRIVADEPAAGPPGAETPFRVDDAQPQQAAVGRIDGGGGYTGERRDGGLAAGGAAADDTGGRGADHA